MSQANAQYISIDRQRHNASTSTKIGWQLNKGSSIRHK